MKNPDSRVTIHMAASLDRFIARKDGRVDCEAFLKTIDCYVMGSRTYETALRFEAQGLGWSYGGKPTFVLTSRELPRTRGTIEFHSGDLAQFVNECLRLGIADEVRYSILPILIGDGVPFFEKLDRDVALHLAEVKAYRSGMVGLRYEVRGHRGESGRQA